MNPKTYYDNNGYLRFKDSKRLVHRYVYEKKLGKKIPEKMQIHHLDNNKKNNQPENLIMLTKEDHYRIQEYIKKFRNIKTINSTFWTMFIIGLVIMFTPFIGDFISIIFFILAITIGVKKI